MANKFIKRMIPIYEVRIINNEFFLNYKYIIKLLNEFIKVLIYFIPIIQTHFF